MSGGGSSLEILVRQLERSLGLADWCCRPERLTFRVSSFPLVGALNAGKEVEDLLDAMLWALPFALI